MTTTSAARTYTYTANVTDLTGGGWMRSSTRKAHAIRTGYRCAICGTSIRGEGKAHMAHMTPRSKGGLNGPDNVVATCQDCNLLMGERTLTELCAVRRNGAAIYERVTAYLALPLDRAAGRAAAARS
jgi:5-methylcytosine-specific restriction endonuclease McrA